MRTPWTPDEDGLLMRYSKDRRTAAEASAALFERSLEACRTRARKIGHPFMQRTEPSTVNTGGKIESSFVQPWAKVHAAREAERAKIKAKAIEKGIPTALRPWADVVRDVERAA